MEWEDGCPFPFTSLSAVVRTAIDATPPLLDRTQRLLLQMLSRRQEGNDLQRIEAIEVEVSEFAQPVQLAFDELYRLDLGGAGFRGMDSGRMQALVQQEQVLAARYGDASFRHVSHIDPRSVLTERRFRWADGLAWEPSKRSGTPKTRSGSSRRSGGLGRKR